jgi:tRNA A-37 threonylcarbamoyl transferase component Bud32
MRKILRKRFNGITWYMPEGEEIGFTTLASPLSQKDTTIIKKGRRKVFASLKGAGGEVYIKVFYLTNLAHRLKHLFFKSKALKELTIGLTAEDRGISAVVPVAAGEKKDFGLLKECYLLVKKIEGALDLKDYLLSGDVPQHRRGRVIEALGSLAKKSHDAGILQADFALNNFLLGNPQDSTPSLYLIDFERARLSSKLSERKRAWTLAKLNRAGGDFSLTDKVRFLRAYMGGTLGKETIHPWMEELERQTLQILRKDAWRIWKACSRGDRGYKLYEKRPLRAYFLEGYDIGDLLPLAEDLRPVHLRQIRTFLGHFEVTQANGKIEKKDRKAHVNIYKFAPLHHTIKGMRPAKGAWQSTNALLKGNFPVCPAIGALERVEGPSYQGFLITESMPGLEDLRSLFQQNPSGPGRQKILWHTARFLSRLHNFGTLALPITSGDIGVLESPGGKMRLYLACPYNFIMRVPSLEDKEVDLQRLEDFLEGLLGEGEREFFRKQYQRHSRYLP